MRNQDILEFNTKKEANDWLNYHDQTGIIHESIHGFIIVRAISGAIVAFTSPTTGTILTEW